MARAQMSETQRPKKVEAEATPQGEPSSVVHRYPSDGNTLGRIFEASFLARDHEKAGETTEALKCFVERAEIGHWSDEVFVTLYRAAQLMEVIGRPIDEAIAAYRRASEAAPSRAEGYYEASRAAREEAGRERDRGSVRWVNRYEEGYEYARCGLMVARPQEGLFVRGWIYDYGLLDEFSVCAYWIGRHQDCFDACKRLLAEGHLPQAERHRVEGNLTASAEALKLRQADDENPLAAKGPKSSSLELIEVVDSVEGDPIELVLVCGPWGSGTSAVSGCLELLGVAGLPPYWLTNDERTPSSYESGEFVQLIDQFANIPLVCRLPSAASAATSRLREFRQHVGQQLFRGQTGGGGSRRIFLKAAMAALFIPEIASVFDTRIICVRRDLGDIERTRLRRHWLPYYGALAAKIIYDCIEAACAHERLPIFQVEYAYLISSPTQCLSDLAAFVGIRPTQEQISQAIDFVTAKRP